jgi:hypothetical protein
VALLNVLDCSSGRDARLPRRAGDLVEIIGPADLVS